MMSESEKTINISKAIYTKVKENIPIFWKGGESAPSYISRAKGCGLHIWVGVQGLWKAMRALSFQVEQKDVDCQLGLWGKVW